MNRSSSLSPVNVPPPIIIIGAGRSGTNILRDVLVQLPGLQTWPCDEINYIWRHGHRSFPTDEFTRHMATPYIAAYIRRQFDWVRQQGWGPTVVEKTCANSLRCGFVHEILPEARFVHLIRDGRDVAVSAAARWTARLNIAYLARKACFVPKGDLLYYTGRYLSNRVSRFFSRDNRLSVWGPRFKGIETAFREHPLVNACAIQWQRCVQIAAAQLSQLPASQVHRLHYEAFTTDPMPVLSRLASFLGISVSDSQLRVLTERIRTRSVGRWKRQLLPPEVESMEQLIGGELLRWGYEVDDPGTVKR